MSSSSSKHWVDYATMIWAAFAALSGAVAAIAAAYQAYIANDAEQKALRAFIEVIWADQGDFTQFDPSKPLRFHFDIRNRGQTPAFETVGKEHAGIYAYPLPADFEFALKVGGEKPSTVFSQGQSPEQINDVWPRPMNEKERQSITEPSAQRLVMYGTVRYKDLFGGLRFTNFCQTYRLTQNGKPWIERCDVHNDAS